MNENLNDDLDLMDDEIEIESIVMTDEDGNDVEYMIIDEFEQNGTNYLVMIRMEDIDSDEVEAVIFKEVEATNDEFVYEEISEEEYNALEEILKQRLDEFDIEAK
ncbi:MAG: DUF1292 domain-containing protein [Defluviitaleaceae bacterium]|nr:DUF1292 domain-containing protein [Defluviitaleaceae bacterium]